MNRSAVPPLFWLLLSIASFAAALGTWPTQRAVLSPTNPAVRPVTPPPPVAAPEPPPALAPVPLAHAQPEPAASAPLRPLAGRQVLRCVLHGRVTYMDVNAACAEGIGERVTVFPTQGVGKPR
jgi:hypothetical protein